MDTTPDLKKEFEDRDESIPSDIDDNIARTMEGLFQDAAKSMPLGEEGNETSDGNNMMPLLESLLSKILSKEV